MQFNNKYNILQIFYSYGTFLTNFIKEKSVNSITNNIARVIKEEIKHSFQKKTKFKNYVSFFNKNVIYDGLNITKHVEGIDRSYLGIIMEGIFILFLKKLEINEFNLVEELKSSVAYEFAMQRKGGEIAFKNNIKKIISNQNLINIINKKVEWLKVNLPCFPDAPKFVFSNNKDEQDLLDHILSLKEIALIKLKHNDTEGFSRVNKIILEIISNGYISLDNQIMINYFYKNIFGRNTICNNKKHYFDNIDKKTVFNHKFHTKFINQFEVDFYHNNFVLELKTSQYIFQTQWFYQLLFYYFALKINGLKDMKYIFIYNPLLGSFIKIELSHIIDINYIEKIIIENDIL